MPRANRNYIPRQVWHITHRCHNRKYLFNSRDTRKRWLYWLSHASQKYGLEVLNYTITNNHIHLLATESEEGCISSSMQLIEGKTAEEYNRSHHRNGSFWTDRYHATLIDSEQYLFNCMLYIDLNMVRAKAVTHPKEWIYGGYQELAGIKKRYGIINFKSLERLTQWTKRQITNYYPNLLEDKLKLDSIIRVPEWTESIAVGSETFIYKTMEHLGIQSESRISSHSGIYALKGNLQQAA